MENDDHERYTHTWGLVFTKKAFAVAEKIDARLIKGCTLKNGQYPVRGDDVILKTSTKSGKATFKVKGLQYDISEEGKTVINILLTLHKGFDYFPKE